MARISCPRTVQFVHAIKRATASDIVGYTVKVPVATGGTLGDLRRVLEVEGFMHCEDRFLDYTGEILGISCDEAVQWASILRVSHPFGCVWSWT